ncbi:MAG TPA: peptidyl-prolyl cis-trans isomerase [Anaeromyxobacteraceae bacterium]|nr:peptidyl-prolyl cis-trans isomerase [Anaeromyxobacteraceae bacterium]
MLPLLLSAALATAPASTVVARVGPDPVTAGEVLARAHGAGLPPLAALETLVREAAVARAARDDGLDRERDVVAAVEAERRSIAARRLVDDEVVSRLQATDAEVAEAFHARHDRVRLSLVVRATQVEAEAALSRLRGGAALIEEGRASSDPMVAGQAGVLGWVTRGALPPGLARTAFTVPPLELAGPVPVVRGFAIVLVHERHLATDAELAPQRDAIRRAVVAAKREGAVARYTAQVAARRRAPRGHELRSLEDEAVARGYGRGPEVERAVAEVQRDLLVRHYLARVVAAAGEPGEVQIAARWREHPEEWTLPPRRPCVHVVAREEDELRRLRARLDGGATVGAAASEAAALQGAHVGGVELSAAELEEWAQSGDEALAAAVASTGADRWTEPVRARRGWATYRCAAVLPAELVPLDQARAAIADRLRRELAERAVERTVARLRLEATVHRDESALAAVVAGQG